MFFPSSFSYCTMIILSIWITLCNSHWLLTALHTFCSLLLIMTNGAKNRTVWSWTTAQVMWKCSAGLWCVLPWCTQRERESNVNTKASTARTLGHEGNQQENMERMRWGSNTFAIMAMVAVYHTLLLTHIHIYEQHTGTRCFFFFATQNSEYR